MIDRETGFCSALMGVGCLQLDRVRKANGRRVFANQPPTCGLGLALGAQASACSIRGSCLLSVHARQNSIIAALRSATI